MQDVVDLFREEHKQWHSKQGMLMFVCLCFHGDICLLLCSLVL